MGLDISYLADEDRLELSLSQLDWKLLGAIGKTYPVELELVAGVEDFGKPRTEKRLELLKAVETLLEQLESESDRLPYVYSYIITEGIAKGCGGTGIISGIKIGDTDFWYELEGGLGNCMLVKRGRDPAGKVYIVERRDIRELKTVKTDNMGEIKIHRTKKPTRLKQTLTQLKAFLAKHTEENITKILG